MRFALLITLTIYSTNAMVNVVPSVNPHGYFFNFEDLFYLKNNLYFTVFVREENELRQHNNYSPPKAIFNKGTNMVAMKRTNSIFIYTIPSWVPSDLSSSGQEYFRTRIWTI